MGKRVHRSVVRLCAVARAVGYPAGGSGRMVDVARRHLDWIRAPRLELAKALAEAAGMQRVDSLRREAHARLSAHIQPIHLRPDLPQVERDRRRAAADPRFRRRCGAELRRLDRPWRPGCLDEAGAPARASTLSALRERRADLLVILGRPAEPAWRPRVAGAALIPQPAQARRQTPAGGFAEYGVSARWGPSVVVADEPATPRWVSGSPRTGTRADRRLRVQSYGVIHPRDPRVLLTRMGDPGGVLAAVDRCVILPEGWVWDVDDLGLRVVSVADPDRDYHPGGEARYLRGPALVARAVGGAAARAALRAALREVRAVAHLEGVLVTGADSVRAGNCAAGTAAWARRAGFSPRDHVPAEALLARCTPGSGGDAERVRVAVAAALVRTRREAERGWADLADHAWA